MGRRGEKKRSVKRAAKAALALLCLSSCAADLVGSKPTPTASTLPFTTSVNAASALVNFNQTDFYSLSVPRPDTSCAGDAKHFYDPLTGAAFAADTFDSTATVRPNFIKNVSVDLTDSNANVPANAAHSCSYGNGSGAPPVSACASFDFGAIQGIPTSMGGTMLLIGGTSGVDYQGNTSGIFNAGTGGFDPTIGNGFAVSCGPAQFPPLVGVSTPSDFTTCANLNVLGSRSVAFALGVGTLPASAANSTSAPGITAATGPISSWSNLSAASTYGGPQGALGASAAYDPGTQSILIFGGSSPLSALTSSGLGEDVYDTYLFNLQTQNWQQLNSNVFVASNLLITPDFNQQPVIGPQVFSFPNTIGARGLFGYTAIPGISISAMSTDGTVLTPGTGKQATMDTTDRIIIVGGITNGGVKDDTHKFNPTYGPELMDVVGANTVVGTSTGALPASAAVQWAASYHTQPLSNTFGSVLSGNGGLSSTGVATLVKQNYSAGLSLFRPLFYQDYLTGSSGPFGGTFGANFGSAMISHTGSFPVLGYVATAGGFDPTTSTNVPILNRPCNDGSGNATIECGGTLMFMSRQSTHFSTSAPGSSV
ncbi:MAG: hypothetical protein ACXWPM_09650, partial [Bdellovibrionota bacterium]